MISKDLLLIPVFLLACLIAMLMSPAIFAVEGEKFMSYQLNDSQLKSLIKLVKTDPDAGAVYRTMLGIADDALLEQPDPVEKIQTEGKLDRDPAKLETEKSLHDMKKIYALGVAWITTGDTRYAVKAKEFILAWAGINKSAGDPIDDTNLEQLIKAYDFLKTGFSGGEIEIVNRWLTDVANAEISTKTPGKSTSMNNWNSHRIKIVGLIGFAIGKKPFVDFADLEYRLQVQNDLNPDGGSYDFTERDALHYHCYTLEPLLSIAAAGSLNGYGWFGYKAGNGSSLKKSVEFLLPYARGEQTHNEYVNSRVKFDFTRAAAGQKKFQIGRVFEPKEALPTLEEYYFFDRSILPLIQKILNTTSKYPSWEILLESAQSPS